jgi:hypothetical protein
MVGQGGSPAFQIRVNTGAGEDCSRHLLLLLVGHAWQARRAVQMEVVICLQRALGKPQSFCNGVHDVGNARSRRQI